MAVYASVTGLAAALRRAEAAHSKHDRRSAIATRTGPPGMRSSW